LGVLGEWAARDFDLSQCFDWGTWIAVDDGNIDAGVPEALQVAHVILVSIGDVHKPTDSGNLFLMKAPGRQDPVQPESIIDRLPK